MSYSFGMFFKQLENKSEIFDIFDVVNKIAWENGREMVKDNYSFWPSQVYGENASVANSFWLDRVFTFNFVYWEEHKLLALVGYDFPKDIENVFDCHICFQNGTDQDYEYSEWNDKITFFKNTKELFMKNNPEELKELFLQYNMSYVYDNKDEEDMTDYYTRSLLYKIIFDKLKLDEWLWGKECDDTFKRYSINALNSSEKRMKLSLSFTSLKKEIEKEFEEMFKK